MKLNNLTIGEKAGIAFGILVILLLALVVYKAKHTPVPDMDTQKSNDTIAQRITDSLTIAVPVGLSEKERNKLEDKISYRFSNQLEYPQKKNRVSQCQFGYNLFLTSMPLYPITEFINPENFGTHDYGGGSLKEKNGSLYTCNGGFIDFAHMRTACDWTVYLTLRIITEHKDFDLPEESGTLRLHFRNLEQLTINDIAALAQKITFERLTWHEIASWYYHMPNHLIMEQQSTFTPEDTYSNILGTEIGKKIVIRILATPDTTKDFATIATEEIEKEISLLNPVDDKDKSREAYDIVDRFKQLKLPVAKRNKDIWWDSDIVFMDPRYVFKRDIDTGPPIEPWLIPEASLIGCKGPRAIVQMVPDSTSSGKSFYDYYTFSINPDSILFYNKHNGEQLHPPFPAFTTNHINEPIAAVKKEMQQKLLSGFDQRDNQDPVARYGKVKRVLFKN